MTYPFTETTSFGAVIGAFETSGNPTVYKVKDCVRWCNLLHVKLCFRGQASERLTREYSTWLFAPFQPAVAASICVQPGSERGFCETAAPRRTCLWDKRPPAWFPGPPPAAGRPLYSERCTPDLEKHRAVQKLEESCFVFLIENNSASEITQNYSDPGALW